MDYELERMKTAINLTKYAADQGYVLQPRESSLASVVMQHSQGDKIIIRRENDGHWVYFSVRDDQDNGSIIDFAMKRRGLTLGQARRELRPWLGERTEPAVEGERFRAEVAPQGSDRVAVDAAFAAAREVATSLYLNRRGIRPETLTCARFRGTWREDSRGNVLFPHCDAQGLSGYEIKNTDFTGFAAGGIKALWHCNELEDDCRLVCTESAIDALSYHQLKPDEATRYISTGGSFGSYQGQVIEKLFASMPKEMTLILAFDNDEAGEKLCREVHELAPKREFVRSVPRLAKDWNEVLQQRERTFIASLPPSSG
jgi:hypothetical protein